MQNVTYLKNPVFIRSTAAVGGREESRSRLGGFFDFTSDDDLFGMKSFERAEGEMSRIALNIALKKCGLGADSLSLITSGDLQNQCVASSAGLFSFGSPYLGLYGACSTFTEGIIIASSYMNVEEYAENCAVVTSSHNSAAERQFRSPLEYGGQRSPSSQWTATAAGAVILSKVPSSVKIEAFMPGKIIDGYTGDKTNMGAAMALAAADSILSFFEKTKETPRDYDFILTGDLGKVGSAILKDYLESEGGSLGSYAAKIHNDAGLILYDPERQDIHSGASGCGCSASVFSSYFFQKLKSGEFSKILLLSTGALMSPASVNQGEHIFGIAPALKIVSI